MKNEDIFADLPELETKHLLLRKMSLDDVGDVFEFSKDPEIFKFVGGKVHQTIEDSRKTIPCAFLFQTANIIGILNKE